MNIQKLSSMLVLLILVAAGLVFTRPTQSVIAQDTWQATVWFGDEVGGYLHIVNGQGVIDTIPVASALVGPDPYITYEVFTSSDNRYIAHFGTDLATQKRFLRFGQTGDGPCCQDLVDTIGDVDHFDLAGFEPNGSRFAVSYLQTVENVDPPFVDGMLVVDGATGEIVYQIDMDLAQSVLGWDASWDWALFEDWTEDGILFLRQCVACDVFPSGEYAIWNPDFTFIGPDSGIYNVFGDTLDLTHELLVEAQDTNYFYDPSPGPIPAPNVVRYYASGNLADTPSIVYANTDTFVVGQVHWVGDGHAFLAINFRPGTWDIVFRDGRVATIQDVGDVEFLGGSPDGWFALGQDSGNPALFHYDLDTLQPTFIAPANTGVVSVQVIERPPLGNSITTPSFASVPPPAAVQTARCPGFLPSRLVVNQYGRVTPGTPNRMRAFESVDSPEVGSIPGGETFLVLEGPSCDSENQIAWWRVDYNGTQGWTAEGQGDTYWTEPVE